MGNLFFGNKQVSAPGKNVDLSYDVWNPSLRYPVGKLVIVNNIIYKAKDSHTASTDFATDLSRGHWEKYIGGGMSQEEISNWLGVTPEQLQTLINIISDTEVRLDKTLSSSKILENINSAIDTSKAFTLAELGKVSSASYKLVNDISEMTDSTILYLLSNGSTYDIYSVIDGVPTKIGATDIVLTDFYTKTEIDTDFLKKSDAILSFATLTALEAKIDKTSVKTTFNAENETPSETSIVSEKALKEAYDKLNIGKVDAIEGKGLSTNDLTDELVQKIMNGGGGSGSGSGVGIDDTKPRIDATYSSKKIEEKLENIDCSNMLTKDVYDTNDDGIVDKADIANRALSVDNLSESKIAELNQILDLLRTKAPQQYFGTDLTNKLGLYHFPTGGESEKNNSIEQRVLLNVVANQEITIETLSDMSDQKAFVQILKFIAGEQNKVGTLKEFNNLNAANFINSKNIAFDENCHITNKYSITSVKNISTGLYESEEIDKASFLEFNGMEMK